MLGLDKGAAAAAITGGGAVCRHANHACNLLPSHVCVRVRVSECACVCMCVWWALTRQRIGSPLMHPSSTVLGLACRLTLREKATVVQGDGPTHPGNGGARPASVQRPPDASAGASAGARQGQGQGQGQSGEYDSPPGCRGERIFAMESAQIQEVL